MPLHDTFLVRYITYNSTFLLSCKILSSSCPTTTPDVEDIITKCIFALQSITTDTKRGHHHRMHSVHFTDPHCLATSPPLSMTAAWYQEPLQRRRSLSRSGAGAGGEEDAADLDMWWRRLDTDSSPPTLIRLLNNVTFLAIIPLTVQILQQ